MSLINENDSLLLIIDVQEKLLNAVFNKDIVLKNSAIVAKTASILGIPTIITEQYPKGLGSTINEIQSVIEKTCSVHEKTSFSALKEEEINKALPKNKKQIVIFGIETHICVNQTIADLIEAGYEVFVVSDACGSRAESEYRAGLNRIKEHGAHIVTTEILLFEWLKSAKHPNFKEIQNLIK